MPGSAIWARLSPVNSPEPVPQFRRKVSYVLSIWAEHQAEGQASWHGALETTGGQHFSFVTLAELERLLCELGGWVDPPEP